jgi:energy-coupling factor transporter ATP-binding protein EcfA2
MNSHFFKGYKELAKYRPSEELIAMHRHNAFIESLPKPFTHEQIGSRTRRRPAYNKSDCNLPNLDRLELVDTISNYIEPLPIFMQIGQSFYNMIVNGYSSRNPIYSEWKKQISEGYPDLDWGEGDYVPTIRSSAAGFAIIGTSGIGKSTSVESLISLYPQVIVHTVYRGISFDQQQVVWLKLDCPSDGSLKALCTKFFQCVDDLLGYVDTPLSYEHKFAGPRVSAEQMLPKMGTTASNIGLGMLVVDEFQRLNQAKSGGAERMLAFFSTLATELSVPVVLVGTDDALGLLNQKLSDARKSEGQGDFIMSNMNRDDPDWDYFIKGLWKYQWTKTETPLTPSIENALYDVSQGILDFAAKVYKLAQWEVIGQEDETITADLIRSMAKERLHLSRDAIEAIRTKDLARLKKNQDFASQQVMNQFMQAAKNRVILDGAVNTLINQQKAEQAASIQGADTLIFEVISWLIEAGVEPEKAKECAEIALKRYGAQPDLSVVKKDAFQLAMGQTSQNEVANANDPKKPDIVPTQMKKRKPTKGKVQMPGGLREIVSRGIAKGVPPDQSLKDAGITKSANHFID